MNVRTVFLSAATLISLASVGSRAADVVEIRVYGHYFSEPATVRLMVTVEPDKDNRTLRIEADGDRLFRSTEVILEGLAEKRLHTVEFKNLPAGSYEVRAEVLSASDVRGMASQAVMVMGVGRDH